MFLHSEKNKQSGFSLTEIIMVLAIMGLVSIGIAQLMLDSAVTGFVTAEKLEINADVRQFTTEMAQYARAANHFYIYRSILEKDRDSKADRLRDGENGDLLVLIYQEPWPLINSTEHFTKIIGYYRMADPNDPQAEGPVYRFEKKYYDPSSPPTNTSAYDGPYKSSEDYSPEDLIADISTSQTFPVVVQLSRGLADGQLFFNYLDRSIMVKAEIIHGNAAKRITDTYNYTVSPRG